MSAKSLDHIYTSFRAGFQDSPDFAIDFYQRHASALDGMERFDNPSQVKYFAELNWHYINALLQKDHYNRSIDEASITLPLIEFESSRLNAPDVRDEWYRGILYLKGMAHYRLRDYKHAVAAFKDLLSLDPENDLYYKWYHNALYGQRLRYTNLIWSVSAVLLLFVLFFEEFLPGTKSRLGLTILGFAGVVGNLAYEYHSRRSFRRVKILDADQS